MGRQVTLELPDDVHRRAERMAALSRQNVKEFLEDAVALVLPPVEVLLEESRPAADLPDDEVLRLSDLRLPPSQDRRLSQLLERQQAGSLTEAEAPELLRLMQAYEVNLLHQAEALAEAVRRGLKQPLAG